MNTSSPRSPARGAEWPVAIEREDPAPLVRKTLDVRRHYGAWATGGSYRIRVFESAGRPPVVVCS